MRPSWKNFLWIIFKVVLDNKSRFLTIYLKILKREVKKVLKGHPDKNIFGVS